MTTRHWTTEERVAALMRLPWTLRVEKDTDGTYVARVAEIPDAIGTGKGRALAIDLWESLVASLEIRLEHGDSIPLPPGCALPWEAEGKAQTRIVRRVRRESGDLEIELSAAAA